jgi:hypothetical protein
MSTTLTTPPTAGALRWGRIVSGAFLLELLLFATLIPLGLVVGMPGIPGSTATDFTIYFTAVPIACFVGAYGVSFWILRPVAARRVLHGALLGIVATLIYLAICATQPGGIAAVAAAYGPLRYWSFNTLRIVGAIAGASHRASPK